MYLTASPPSPTANTLVALVPVTALRLLEDVILVAVHAAPAVSGGGHYGIEALVSPRSSFTFEVGGQAPIDNAEARDGGASVMAGLTVYLGALGSGT